MSSTLIYHLTLFLHILGAFGLIATMTLESVGLRGLRQAETADAARASLKAMQFVPPLGGGSGALILLTGLYMMATSWGVRGWILVGIAGLVLNALAGAIITRSRLAIVGPAAGRASGTLTDDVRATLRDPLLLASLRLRLGIVLGILFIMTVKPSALASIAVVGAAGLVGLLTTQLPLRRDRRELGTQSG
ncbi:MAG TPA: hypothetical protein VM674_02530 [Candidatus Acidoferrum sp.]|nr:hypothetical protein [Candidatus Acidoferrum sp.]